MRSARRALLLLAATALIAVTAGCSHHSPKPVITPPPSPSVVALPADQTANLQTKLASADAATVGTVLAPGLASSYTTHPFTMLPAGSSIHIDAAKLSVSGTLATVPAQITGPHRGTWLLLLTNVNGVWLVYGTVQQ